MIVTLIAGNASSTVAAICRHQSVRAHAMALQSHDKKIAAVALTEETAASVSAKKGAVSHGGSVPILAHLLPPAALSLPLQLAEPARRQFPDGPVLNGTLVRPLLQPPLA